MKTLILLTTLTAGIILLSGIVFSVRAETETQKYETLYEKDNFEIRFYPQAIMASVTVNGTYDDTRNSGFRVLAGYIFGGNKEEEKIAMTSPVRMQTDGNENTMSFVLPSEMDFENLPEPRDESIVLHQSNPIYTASIRYGGWTSSKEIEKMKTELMEIIDELGLEFKPGFEYLGYNPPWQMVNRRNEVLVELNNFNIENFERSLVNR